MLILTGGKGCGKTTLLQRTILDNNLAVQGFLSLKMVEDGIPVGIRLLTLPWREEIFTAISTPERTALSTGHYAFEPEAFRLIDERFTTFDKNLPFVLDEFGRLEMRGLGHFDLFQRLVTAQLKLLVVVRKDLLASFLERHAHAAETVVLDVESGDESLCGRVYEYLCPEK